MQLFNGKDEASKLENKIKAKLAIEKYDKKLLVVQIGNASASKKYVQLKKKLCSKLGIPVEVVEYSAHESIDAIRDEVKSLFESSEVGGGIIQLPLPSRRHNALLDLIPLSKDLDLLSGAATRGFYEGQTVMFPPVFRAIDHFVKTIPGLEDLKNLKVLVVGGGSLVGLPAAKYFATLGASVYLSDVPKVQKEAKNLMPFLESARLYECGSRLDYDLILLGVGRPALVDPADVKHGAHVIDYGYSVKDSRVVGDLDYSAGIDHLGSVSPSPGGMGPLVVRYLIMNLLKL